MINHNVAPEFDVSADEWTALLGRVFSPENCKQNDGGGGGVKILRGILERMEALELASKKNASYAERLRHLENTIAIQPVAADLPLGDIKALRRELAKMRVILCQTTKTLCAVADFLGDPAVEKRLSKLCNLTGECRNKTSI